MRAPKKVKPGLSLTMLLILTNIVFFIAVLSIAYQNEALMAEVAITPATAFSKPWTFITSMFMHGNFFHIFVNMLSLFFLGTFLEKLIGKRRFFWLYLAAGLGGGLFFVLFSVWPFSVIPGLGVDPSTPAVGASGALFGLGGVLALLTPRLPVYVMFIPVALPLWFGITLMFVVLCLLTAFANFPIGNAAHLGGLLVGLAFGLYLRLKYPRKVALLDRFFRFRR